MRTSRATILGVAATAMFSLGALAQESRHGTISRLDEANGTIAISEAQAGTTGSSAGSPWQEYKLQDGLVFNAFKEGDSVSFTVEEKGGVKTITNLQKQ
jgi:Cu/Ag efflux protein CusF